MTTPISGSSSNLTPDYTTGVDREQAKKADSQRASAGAKLAKDSLEIPYEKQMRIEIEQMDAGRPFLPTLFRMRFVNDDKGETLHLDYYKTLRDSLPPILKDKLEKDEAQLDLEDRDPDMIALDSSLRFEANLLALADRLAVPGTGDEKVLLRAKQFLALPPMVKQELMAYGKTIVNFLNHHLAKIGPNDESHEILSNVSNQIQEALHLLNINDEDSPYKFRE